MTEQQRRRFRVTRDGMIFFVGLAGIIFEAFVRSGGERPTLLILFAGMIGLPVMLHSDEQLKKKDSPPPESPPPVATKQTSEAP